jgi:hypothetical protein
MKEKRTTTCTIYVEDLAKVRAIKEKYADIKRGDIKNLADVLRIALEYADAHSVFP